MAEQGLESGSAATAGLVRFKKQVGRVEVLHSDAQRRRLSRMKLMVKGAAAGLSKSMQDLGKRYRVGFGTLTYATDDQWEPRHISDLMRHYRKWCKRRGVTFRVVWVAELTKRGRVHYHYCFWVPLGITPPKPDKQGWWPHGSTQVKWARNPVGYLLKYASKGNDTDHKFPKGCRICGFGGDTGNLGWFRAPEWMRKFGVPYDEIRKKDGFWCNFSTGVGYRSPWIFSHSDIYGITLKWVGWTVDDVWFIYAESF